MGKGPWLPASTGKANESSEPDRAQSPDPRRAATSGGIRPAIDLLGCHQAFRVVSLFSRGFFLFLDRRAVRGGGKARQQSTGNTWAGAGGGAGEDKRVVPNKQSAPGRHRRFRDRCDHQR